MHANYPEIPRLEPSTGVGQVVPDCLDEVGWIRHKEYLAARSKQVICAVGAVQLDESLVRRRFIRGGRYDLQLK